MKRVPRALSREQLLKGSGTAALAALLVPALRESAAADVPLNLTFTETNLGYVPERENTSKRVRRLTEQKAAGQVILKSQTPPDVPGNWTWADLYVVNMPTMAGKDEDGHEHGSRSNPKQLHYTLYVLVGGNGTKMRKKGAAPKKK